MPTILNTKSTTYDQVNLIAQPQSRISSRATVPQELHRIIVAPMESVVGKAFAIEAIRLGLSVCLHRFNDVEAQLDIYKATGKQNLNKIWIAVGLNEWDRVKKIKKEIENPNILVDVANGYLYSVVKFAKELTEANCKVMVGNVHSSAGIKLYQDAEIQTCHIRVGIGGGSVCKTSTVTGFTRGSISELQECCNQGKVKIPTSQIGNIQKPTQMYIIADGDIKGPGEANKAFGIGAEYIMMGGYFSKALEANNAIEGTYKYWGGASAYQQIRLHKPPSHVEGTVKENSPDDYEPLEFLVKKLWDGISSGVSYSGYATLKGFIGNGVFELKS